MKQHGITALFHFTQASNLSSIFQHGLLPRKTICKQGLDADFNDNYRYDNCPDALCMSIEFPNYKMFYSLRMKNADIDWVVIKLDAKILLDFRCAFCVTNAGSEESYSIDIQERLGCTALKKLYKDYPCQPSRDKTQIKNCFPTNPQAEVLVFNCVPLEYIKEVYFNDESALCKYNSYIPSKIKAKINTNYFSYREDWQHWKKGD